MARSAGQDRAAAARALLVLGDLHALKGDGKDRRVYERLRSEYSDQKVRADAAISRLRNPGVLIHGWRWPALNTPRSFVSRQLFINS